MSERDFEKLMTRKLKRSRINKGDYLLHPLTYSENPLNKRHKTGLKSSVKRKPQPESKPMIEDFLSKSFYQDPETKK